MTKGVIFSLQTISPLATIFLNASGKGFQVSVIIFNPFPHMSNVQPTTLKTSKQKWGISPWIKENS